MPSGGTSVGAELGTLSTIVGGTCGGVVRVAGLAITGALRNFLLAISNCSNLQQNKIHKLTTIFHLAKFVQENKIIFLFKCQI